MEVGYWRLNSNSSYPILCENEKENCMGGYYTGEITCKIGHIGALCESCDI